ncbi:MAG: hypothetical protein KDK39_18510 [Leptospiraceae bacterium]|nr:hypothetical protein [Leptospiraceae bacterium]
MSPAAEQGAAAPDSGEESSSRSKSRGQRFVRRYYPVFESLILFILDYQSWWRAFKAYIQDELDYRSGLVLQTVLLFFAGISLIFFALIWILLGCFFLLRIWTGSEWMAAFIVGGIFYAIGHLVLFLMLKISRKVFDSKNKPMDWDDDDLEDFED